MLRMKLVASLFRRLLNALRHWSEQNFLSARPLISSPHSTQVFFMGGWGGGKSVVFQLECILGSQLDLVFAHQRLEARHGIAPIGDDLHALFQRQFRFL